LRDDVGNYVDESLPNIKGDTKAFGPTGENVGNGSFVLSEFSNANISSSSAYSNTNRKIELDASLSSSTYQDGAPVQQRATQMYLYFYVGNTLRKKSEIDLGVLMELLETVQQPTITYWGD
jgi:hypothetical protein